MKRKVCIGLLIIAILAAIITNPVMALTEEPKLDNTTFKVKGVVKEFFFANGTPIIIEARTDSNPGALIKWNGGQKEVGPDAYIFGGMHNDDTKVSTSIIMNSGTVRTITGGGLHKSYTVKSNIIINGGNVGAIQGGGCDGISFTCGCTANLEDANPSTCQVEDANVTINGGTIKYTDLSYGVVFGGGEGYSNTVKSKVTINGGDLSKAYVVAGGSNGNTTEAELNITGGKIMIAQSVNRGTMTNATLKVTGGEIKNLYVAAEPDTKVGNITGTVQVEVSGDAKVKNMQLGQMGTEVITAPNNVIKEENIKIVEGTVEDTDSAIKDNVAMLNEVKIDGKTYLVEPGKTIKDLPEYEKIITKEGHKFVEFKTANGKWNEEDRLTNGLELTTVFEKIETSGLGEAIPEPETPEKDDTPKTGSVDAITIICGVLALVSLVAIVVKKNNT